MEKKKKMDSKWRSILLGAIIFVGIVIVALLIYLVLSSKSNQETKIPTEKSFNEQVLESCLVSCENNECEKSCEDVFLLYESQTLKDESLCKKIKDKNILQDCEESAVLNNAMGSLDISLCNSFSEDKKSSCVYSVILKKPW